MENNDNMAQQTIQKEFTPLVSPNEKKFIKLSETVKEKLKNSLFNNTKTWPVYTHYLPKNDPRYTGL